MAKSDDFMLTADELRLRRARWRRRVVVLGSIIVVVIAGVFTARPAGRAIKAFQARRHAARAFAFLEKEQWSEARGEALAAYQLRQTEPQALRAVARYLTRTRQQQALEFWQKLRDFAPLTRDDLRDEATIALISGDPERATQAVNDLLADDGKKATPHDWLIAAQVALQKGAAPEALRDLGEIFENSAATERELLQAAILELQASGSADAEANARAQADAWARLTKMSEGKSETALDALMLLARRALASPSPGGTSAVSSSSSTDATPSTSSGEAPVVPPNSSTVTPPPSTSSLIAAIENHPLAKAPQKLVALDLKMHENLAEKEACILRAIADWKDADSAGLIALATWLNGRGEFQRELETIPLEKALGTRDLFLQHLDALGALSRWQEIKLLLEAERFPLDAVIQRMYLARCNAQLGQKAAGENNWQRALEAAGTDIQKLLTLANYAEKNGALDIARTAYDSAAVAAPKLRATQQGRLRVAQAARDTRKMHVVLAEMLALWPNDTAIQNDEAYVRLLLWGQSQVESRKEKVEWSRREPSDMDEARRVRERERANQKAEPAAENAEPITENQELITLEQLAAQLVQREPASLPHRTLLALARLKQKRPLAALEAYANIQAAPNALSPSALAIHAAVLFANGNRDDALKEIAQVPVDRLLPEEAALIAR